MSEYAHGWYQVAFTTELTQELTPVNIGNRMLVLAQTANGLKAYDAACPHRGANLAYGGRIERGTIVCPFHGYRIGMGRCGITAERGFFVREYSVLVVGESVFVRLSDEYENGFAAALRELQTNHKFYAGFTRILKVSNELVIENGFDAQHFKIVHGVFNQPELVIKPSESGELRAEGFFEYPKLGMATSGVFETQRVPFKARAISPGLIISSLEGADPYTVITGATPTTHQHECRVWVSVAVPVAHEGDEPNPQLVKILIEQSAVGIEKDSVVWEHLVYNTPTRLTSKDTAVAEYQAFCRNFYA